jgi:hypothetical protein
MGLLVLGMGAGCVGYRLGTTLPPGIASIYIPTFENNTDEPRLETETTRAAIQEFQRDGTLKIAGERDADARLDVVLLKFELLPLRYEKDQSRTTREYRMLIRAKVTVTRTDNGEVLAERTVVGDEEFDFFGDLATSKIQNLPEAAEDLAHRIVELIVEYW